MIGHLNMTFKELNNGERTGVSIECQLKNVTTAEKFAAIHQVLEALAFGKEELHMLSLAALLNRWPDSDDDDEKD